MNFKIVFPTGYQVRDILNDNIDINVVLENGEVYFGVLFTMANVQYFFDKDGEPFFWNTDMLIIKDLSQETIRESIAGVLKEQILDKAFTKIGYLGDEGRLNGLPFNEIIDMGTGWNMGL